MQKSALILAHGSEQEPESTAAYVQAKRVEAQLGIRVEYAFKDCDGETMHRKLSALATGSDEIVVIPLFFASSAFSERMVPRKVGLEEGARSGVLEIDGKRVLIRIGRPFGEDPLMNGVIGTMLAREGAHVGGTAVMLIGHGSKDGANSKAVEYNAGIVRDFGYDAFPCYNEFNEPTIEKTLEYVLTREFTDVLAIPLFVSAGNHTTVDIPGKLGLMDRDSERTVEGPNGPVRIRCTKEVGMEPGIADILCRTIRPRTR